MADFGSLLCAGRKFLMLLHSEEYALGPESIATVNTNSEALVNGVLFNSRYVIPLTAECTGPQVLFVRGSDYLL